MQICRCGELHTRFCSFQKSCLYFSTADDHMSMLLFTKCGINFHVDIVKRAKNAEKFP